MWAKPEKVVLPPKYYLEYFQFLIGFVERKYKHLLVTNELAFLDAYHALSEDEACLFIRFCNRTGLFFDSSKLKYEEIANIPQIMESLINKKFIEKPNASWKGQSMNLIKFFSKADLLKILKIAKIDIKNSAQYLKEDLVQKVFYTIDHESFVEIVDSNFNVIKVNYEVEVMMLKFLFFGNRHDSMTEFVTRDLGFQRYETFDEEKLVAFFNNRQEVEDRLLISLFAEKFYELSATLPLQELAIWFINWVNVYQNELTEPARMVLERQKTKAGAFFEKNKFLEEAYEIYQMTDLSPARERSARILHKLGQNDEAMALCQKILGMPNSNDEMYFALDFIKKLEGRSTKKKVKKAVTEELHQSESITIAATWRNNVERGVIDYYTNLGKNAVFAENYLWKNLFGLLFWDIIYDTESMAIHHPLQRAPSDVYKPIFFEIRRDKLLDRLDLLHNKEVLKDYITKIFEEKRGIVNPFVDWAQIGHEATLVLCNRVPSAKLRLVMLEMATNIKSNSHGFPDLFVWDEDSYEFVEVKSPTDNLSNQQLFWLKFFERNQIPSKVLRVFWE